MEKRITIGFILLVIGGIAYEVGDKIGTMKHDTTPYFWGIGIAAVCMILGVLMFFGFRK